MGRMVGQQHDAQLPHHMIWRIGNTGHGACPNKQYNGFIPITTGLLIQRPMSPPSHVARADDGVLPPDTA